MLDLDTPTRLAWRLALTLLLGGALALACRAAQPPTPTATPEIIADCFWSAQAYAWLDSDGDGVQDESEPPLAGVEINFSLTFLSSGTTGADGLTHLSGMHPGECNIDLQNSVVATAPEGYDPTTELSVPYFEDQDLYEFGFRPVP